MSDPHPPPHPPLLPTTADAVDAAAASVGLYHSPSTDFQGNEQQSYFNDPTVGQYSQAAFGSPPFNYEMIPAVYTENPAGVPRIPSNDRTLNSKVAIPRSATSSHWTTSGRVSRACENCRDQKAKCSGHRPTCQRCQESGIRCSYGDRKREKMAKQLSDLTNQVQVYEDLLREICPKLDLQSAQYVQRVVDEQKFDNDQSSGRQTSISSSASRLVDAALMQSPGPASLGGVDHTNQDFNRDERTQAMGFLGEHSEIAWLYRLKQLLVRPASNSPREPLGHSVGSVNFFLDDSDMFVLDDVDLTRRPPPTLADQLINIYFEIVHPSFPIIGKLTFLKQYQSFNYTPFLRPGKRWLAILNLIFAIAGKYSRLINANPLDTADNDRIYFLRAWKLSMSDVVLLDHPNLQQVQVEGLTSFYLASVGQVNRSWRICGISIRSAVAMGLNLRSESSSVAPTSKEARYRVWWSLYMLDISLSVMTGRPPSCSDQFSTTPLPVPFQEEEFSSENINSLLADNEARTMLVEGLSLTSFAKSPMESSTPETPRTLSPNHARCEQIVASASQMLAPNISLYFLYAVDLGLIIRESVDTLYAPGAARKSWRELEMAISMLNGKADSWLAKLPAAFHFTQGHDGYQRERLSLAFGFYSARILITQPCFSRHIQQAPGNDVAGSFSEAMATMCLDVAGQMLDLFPDLPSSAWIYCVSPWWCVLHHLMQSTTVLLTELLLVSKPGTAQHTTLMERICKATRWLAQMSTEDPSFQRAQLVCRDLISQRDLNYSATVNTERS